MADQIRCVVENHDVPVFNTEKITGISVNFEPMTFILGRGPASGKLAKRFLGKILTHTHLLEILSWVTASSDRGLLCRTGADSGKLKK
jgi:hypothetical protein